MTKRKEDIIQEFPERKMNLELRKLELENDELEFKNSEGQRKLEHLKAFAGIGGIITGLATIIAIVISVYQWSAESEQNRIIRIEERLDKTILNLGNDSPKTRIASVIAMQTFLGKEYKKYHAQVLLSLVNLLSTEEESGIRSAIIQVVNEIDTKHVDKSILENSLSMLINFSRYYVESGELYKQRITNEFMLPKPDSHESIARDIGKIIIELLRKDIRIEDMSGLFCVKCDFSELDLNNISFEDAILAWSDFSNSELGNANFDGADLEETNFNEADLSYSIFTYNGDKRPGYRDHYVERQLDEERYQTAVFGPDFTNANLSNADFTGHILFGFTNDSAEYGVMSFNPSFRGSNLSNANFREIGIYGTTYNTLNDDSHPPKIVPISPLLGSIGLPMGRTIDGNYDQINFNVFVSSVDSSSSITQNIRYFQNSVNDILSQIEDSNWKSAHWPKAIYDILNNEEKYKKSYITDDKLKE